MVQLGRRTAKEKPKDFGANPRGEDLWKCVHVRVYTAQVRGMSTHLFEKNLFVPAQASYSVAGKMSNEVVDVSHPTNSYCPSRLYIYTM